MVPLSHTRTHPQSTPAVNPPSLANVPITQLIARIAAVEGWLIDLAAGTPGAIVDGLDPAEIDRVARLYLAEIDRVARLYLSRVRAEIVRREFTAEAAS